MVNWDVFDSEDAELEGTRKFKAPKHSRDVSLSSFMKLSPLHVPSLKLSVVGKGITRIGRIAEPFYDIQVRIDYSF